MKRKIEELSQTSYVPDEFQGDRLKTFKLINPFQNQGLDNNQNFVQKSVLQPVNGFQNTQNQQTFGSYKKEIVEFNCPNVPQSGYRTASTMKLLVPNKFDDEKMKRFMDKFEE